MTDTASGGDMTGDRRAEIADNSALIAFVIDFAEWFAKWDDLDDDCGFINGDSDKYKGENGQEQLSVLGERAKLLLQLTAHHSIAKAEGR